MLVTISAVFVLILAITSALGWPFLIGKPKTGMYTAGGYIFVLLQCAAMAILAGRVFGWW